MISEDLHKRQSKFDADKLALEFGRINEPRIRYDVRRRRWLVKYPDYWEPDNRLLVQQTIREFLRANGGATAARISAVERMCRTDPRLIARGDEL